MAYVVLWRFRVRPEHAGRFERAYGPMGDWAKLFGACKGFLGMELVREASVPGVYVTIDRWRAASDYDAMLRENVGTYTRLDEECAALTLTEEKLGAFEMPGDRRIEGVAHQHFGTDEHHGEECNCGGGHRGGGPIRTARFPPG